MKCVSCRNAGRRSELAQRRVPHDVFVEPAFPESHTVRCRIRAIPYDVGQQTGAPALRRNEPQYPFRPQTLAGNEIAPKGGVMQGTSFQVNRRSARRSRSLSGAAGARCDSRTEWPETGRVGEMPLSKFVVRSPERHICLAEKTFGTPEILIASQGRHDPSASDSGVGKNLLCCAYAVRSQSLLPRDFLMKTAPKGGSREASVRVSRCLTPTSPRLGPSGRTFLRRHYLLVSPSS